MVDDVRECLINGVAGECTGGVAGCRTLLNHWFFRRI
jgi:hypothetical protein